MAVEYRQLCFTVAIVAVFSAVPLHAQDRAQSRARTTDANTAMRDDSSSSMIVNRVYNRIASSGSLAGTDIRVRMDGNTVVLEGAVADQQAKDRAAQIAMRTKGVDNVRNELRIDSSLAAKNQNANIPDDQLSKQIAEKLVRELFPNARVERDWMFGWEVEGENWEFEIDADDGDITISGDVPRTAVITEILQKVRSMPGVRKVDSYLQPNTGYYYGPYRGAYYPFPHPYYPVL